MDASQRACHVLSEAFSDVDCTLSLGTPATRRTQLSSSTQLSRLASPVHDRDNITSGVMPLWPYTNLGTKVTNPSNFATMEDLKRVTSCRGQEQTVRSQNSAFCALSVPVETRSSNLVAVSGGAKSDAKISDLSCHEKLKQADCHDRSGRSGSSLTSSLTQMIDISSYQESGDRISTYKPPIPHADSCQKFNSSLDLSCMSLSSCPQTFIKMSRIPGFVGTIQNFTDHCNAARTCAHCGTTKTPLWRNGPLGPKSLCNACGIRFKKVGRRVSSSNRDMQSWNMHTSASYISPVGSTVPPFNNQDYDRDTNSYECATSSAQNMLFSRESPSKIECNQILHAEKKKKVFQTMFSNGLNASIEVPAASRVNLESYNLPSIMKSSNPSLVTCVLDESSIHSENTNPVQYESDNHMIENSESDMAKAESTSTKAVPKGDEEEGAFLLMTLSSGVVKA